MYMVFLSMVGTVNAPCTILNTYEAPLLLQLIGMRSLSKDTYSFRRLGYASRNMQGHIGIVAAVTRATLTSSGSKLNACANALLLLCAFSVFADSLLPQSTGKLTSITRSSL